MDVLNKEQRTRNMRNIKGKNTKPELLLRRALHAYGLRFRLHRRNLPGRPDIVFPKYKTVVFVHGCFWHRHPHCRLAATPKSQVEFWTKKFEKNMRRDNDVQKALADMGWNVVIVWECELKHIDAVVHELKNVLDSRVPLLEQNI